MHRQQLDGGHAESFQVVDHRRVGQPAVGASPRFGYRRMQLRETLDVRFIDHGVRPRGVGPTVVAPVEHRRRHDRPRHEPGAVDADREQLRSPAKLTTDSPGVRVHQQLRVVHGGRSAHPESVACPRPHVGHVGPPYVIGALQWHAALDIVIVKQHQIDGIRRLGVNGEGRPGALPVGTECGRCHAQRNLEPQSTGWELARATNRGRADAISSPRTRSTIGPHHRPP